MGATGAGLVVLNFWASPGRDSIPSALFSNSSKADQLAAHKALVSLAGSVVFVAICVLLAGINDTWAKGLTTVMFGIGLVWAVNTYNAKGN